MADVDVLVIGAGMAGLTATRDLAAQGAKVRILEARDRLGGRTYTRPFAGRPELVVEAGGAYLNPRTEHNLRQEAERYGIELSALGDGPDDVRFVVLDKLHRSLPVPADQLSELERVLVRLQSDTQRINPVIPLPQQPVADLDCSIAEYLARLSLSAETYDLVAGALAGFIQADIYATSMLQVLLNILNCGGSPVEAHFGTFQGTFANGIGDLVQAMVTDAGPDVVLNATVTAVEQRADEVVVTTDSGETHTAPACVVAAPAWTLRSIAFTPPLAAAKRRLLERPHAIRGCKKLLVVEGAPPGFFGIGGLSAHYQWLMVDRDLGDGQVLMVGFSIGEQHHDNHDLDLARAAVRQYLPEATVLAVDGEDWYHDPLTRGIVGFCPTGSAQSFSYEMSRPDGRIAFAGSEMVPDVLFFGWIEGAIASGHEAARYVGTVLVR